MGTKRIFLWSSPRNISTALMYSFAQRKDTLVHDEPLYGYYLKHTQAKEYHPGAQEIIDDMETDGEMLVTAMVSPSEKPVLFFKNMTHHLVGLNQSFLKAGTNVILTRDPREMLPSFEKVIAAPTMEDVGYQMQVSLLHLLQEWDLPVVVLDAKKVLLNPGEELKKLCDAINIPFDQGMLQWEAGARPEDGVWSKYWYANVHQSTGFNTYVPKTAPFPEKLQPLLNACQPCYQELIKNCL